MNALHSQIEAVLAQLNRVILGKDAQIRLCVACLLARGHLLIEDIPGVGKTTLAHGIAQTLGLSFQRIQFTSDLLPADVLGVSIFDRETGKFRFQRGPIFAQLVLADEINRASPKAQSALLEAMEEHQVTLDGQSMASTGAFLCHRHAKSSGSGRHISAARIATGSIPDARAFGLPGGRRGARIVERRRPARSGEDAADHYHAGQPAPAAAKRARDPCLARACSTTCRRSWRTRAVPRD